jgi:hypothetical protein
MADYQDPDAFFDARIAPALKSLSTELGQAARNGWFYEFAEQQEDGTVKLTPALTFVRDTNSRAVRTEAAVKRIEPVVTALAADVAAIKATLAGDSK